MEKVTVALTTFNRAHMVSKALNHILNQSYGDIKIIVIDNGSSDNTQEVLKSYKDTRLKVVRKETNDLNVKMEILNSCETEYLIMTHDDDWMAPEMIERELNIMEGDKEIIMVSVGADYYAEDGETFLFSSFTKDSILFDKFEYFKYICRGSRCENIVINPSAMLRVKECKEIDYSFMDDHDFLPKDVYWWLSLNKIGKLYVSGEKLFRVREHKIQFSANKIKLFTELATGIGEYLRPYVTLEEHNNFVKYYYAKIQIYNIHQKIMACAEGISKGDYGSLKKELMETEITLNYPRSFYFEKEEVLEKFLQNILFLKDKYKGRPVNYILWGCGGCGLNTQDLISVYLPNFKLCGFIDKYKKGELKGIPVVSPEEYDFCEGKGRNLIIISTIEGAYDIVRFFNDIGLEAFEDYNLGYFLYE